MKALVLFGLMCGPIAALAQEADGTLQVVELTCKDDIGVKYKTVNRDAARGILVRGRFNGRFIRNWWIDHKTTRASTAEQPDYIRLVDLLNEADLALALVYDLNADVAQTANGKLTRMENGAWREVGNVECRLKLGAPFTP